MANESQADKSKEDEKLDAKSAAGEAEGEEEMLEGEEEMLEGEEGEEAEEEQSASGEESDLKDREYRDAQGNVHHHTRTSGAYQAKKTE